MRALLFVLTMLFTSAALAETVSIVASQDNTIYDDGDGTLSNGSGNHFFAGRIVNNSNRRALLAFKELSAIPSGATIESVKLHVRMNREESPATNVSLLRLNSDWGEGTSDAAGPEGMGTAAETGDATWIHTFFDEAFWNTPGGDFSEVASAQLMINDPGSYTFGSTNAMVNDVQDWLDNPETNFGWILIANENVVSARRFSSRENGNIENRPTLEVEYSMSATFQINEAMSDAWFFPDTSGQGFFIIVWEDQKLVFLAWFTYDTERPPQDVTALLGEPGHRWLTALGPYDGDSALLDVFLSSGMIFDSGEPEVTTEQLEGATIWITWSSCTEGVLKYDIPSLGLSGDIPIQRIVDDNVAACEAAQAQ